MVILIPELPILKWKPILHFSLVWQYNFMKAPYYRTKLLLMNHQLTMM